MERLSIEQYWERLERHDWFYPWCEGTEEYDQLVKETRILFSFSRLSIRHGQLYTTYHRMMYANVIIDENDNVGNIGFPTANKPEAA